MKRKEVNSMCKIVESCGYAILEDLETCQKYCEHKGKITAIPDEETIYNLSTWGNNYTWEDIVEDGSTTIKQKDYLSFRGLQHTPEMEMVINIALEICITEARDKIGSQTLAEMEHLFKMRKWKPIMEQLGIEKSYWELDENDLEEISMQDARNHGYAV